MTATPGPTHYHVLAVQDWYGSQEWCKGWDDQLTLTQAMQFADDMIRADTLYMAGEYAAGEAEFGDRFHDLISSNVAPGWNGVWIVNCDNDNECRFKEIFHGRTCPHCGHTATPGPESWGEPYWQGSTAPTWHTTTKGTPT